MSIKKISLSFGVLFLAAIFLSGCLGKDSQVGENQPRVSRENQSAEKNSSVDISNPAEKIDVIPATGKVSDLVSAAEKDVADEKKESLDEESDVKEAISTEEEASDFGQIYDENEF